MKPKKLVTLKKNKEFGYVYRRGTRLKLPDFTFIYVKSRYGGFRAGFAVSKKVGNSVIRNLCRRRLKEALREYLGVTEGNYSVIFYANPKIANSGFNVIKDEIEQALYKSQIIKSET